MLCNGAIVNGTTIGGRAIATAADAALVPALLIATTLQKYVTPFCKPPTVMGDELPDTLTPTEESDGAVQVALKLVIAAPPLYPGAVNDTATSPFAGVTTPMVGASGTVAGVTATVAEATLGPAALVATTEQVYAVPLVNPVTVSGEARPVAVKPPALHVTV